MIIFNDIGFVHIPKTAGESIRTAILESENDCYYVGKVWNPEEDIKSNNNRYRPHYPPHLIKPFLSPELKLVTCVRNPWDRYVSWYGWHCQYRGVAKSWDNFLASILDETDPKRITSQGEFLGGVDWELIIQFELLEKGWRKFQTLSGINSELPKMNQSKRGNYRDYYTERTQHQVAEKEREVIERFNYTF